MGSSNQDFVTRLLKQSILTLCKEACDFKQRIEVDGIVCIVIDNAEQHVIKIHEFIEKEQTSEILRKENIDTHNRSPSLTSSYEEKNEPEVERSVQEMTPIVNKDGNVTDDVVEVKMEPESDNDSKTGETECNSVDGNGQLKNESSSISSLTSSYQRIGLERLTMSTAKNILCKKCNKVLDNVGLFEAHNMTSHGHFTCLICLATFTSRNNMKRHIRLHTGIKPYTCHKCSESFSRNDDFKRHLLKHTFQKPFRCSVCKTGYSDRSCVRTHMLKEHNSKTFHICPQCGETYLDIQAFQQHKKYHPEFQDYRCSVCSFTGSNALMYNKHMLTHGPPKNYKCNHCEISFPDPFTYTGHLKKHKGNEIVQSYICCFCDTSLPTFEQFQRHEHSHVHCKQHVCSQCNKVFRYPSNLREHMLTHMPKIDLLAGFSKSRRTTLNMDGASVHPTILTSNNITSLNGMQSSNGVVDMAIEENNNHVVSDKRHCESDNEGSQLVDDMSGSSEYWCTECNHGFGTESELKSHIEQKHELNHEIVNDSEESSHDLSADMETIDSYIDLNSEESSLNKHLSVSSSNHDHNMTGSKKFRSTGCQNVDEILTMKSRHRAYDEETVIDQDEFADRESVMRTSTTRTSAYPSDMTESELEIVQDAMRQVQEIQSKFGIKTSDVESKVHNQTLALTPDADESRNRWSNPSSSFNTPNTDVQHQALKLMSVTMSGMKMKIQRGTTSNNDKETGSKEGESPDETIRNTTGFQTLMRSHSKTANTPNTSILEQYSKTSVLGMNTEFSESPNRSTATKINLKVRNPGFERVVTPEILFKTKAPFTCEVCQETFDNFELFHEHGVRIHRRFICSYCGKVFTSRPNRERHVRYHTGEKPYKCDLCPASFLRGDDLKYHRTTKHADVKPFTCGACQTSFALPKDLEKHLRIYPDHKL